MGILDVGSLATPHRRGKLTIPGFDCVDCEGVPPPEPVYKPLF